jgi:hypothetical protein
VYQQDRTNIEMAQIVEQGISRDQLHGSVVAWRFLSSHHVPTEVILRVLSDPAKRRESDAQPVPGIEGAISPNEVVAALYPPRSK